MKIEILRPPSFCGWKRWPLESAQKENICAERWYHQATDLQIISGVCLLSHEDSFFSLRKRHAELRYHLSVSGISPNWGERFETFLIHEDKARWALQQFGLSGDEMQECTRGVVRHYFKSYADFWRDRAK